MSKSIFSAPHFDINERGVIALTPLVSYEAAILLETGCGLRLVLASPEDQLGTGSIVVQMAMTVEQAQELARDLLKMVEKILEPPLTQPQ